MFHVGDEVTFLYGNGRVRGTIVEDRGCLGRGGRRLYGIRFEPNPEDYAYTEMGDDELSPAKP
jgi:hypothetical protein